MFVCDFVPASAAAMPAVTLAPAYIVKPAVGGP